jgi:MFS family permease
MNKLLSRLPHVKNKNVALFYIFSIIHACYFAEGNWIFLYLFYFNYATIGLLDSIAFTIWVLLEIPAGSIADIIGRKRVIRFSFLAVALGILMQALASSPVMLFLGNVIFYIGLAFYSGSMEALTYDTLIEAKVEKDFDKIVATSKSLQAIAYVIAVLIGGYASSINIRLPFLIWGVVHAFAFIISFMLKEPKVDSIKVTLKSYLSHNLKGIKELFKPQLKPYLFFIFIVLGVVFWYDWGFIKPAVVISFGFDSISMGYIFALEGLLIAILLPLLPKIRKMINDYTGLVILNFLVVLSIFLFGSDIGYWGVLPIVTIALAGNFAYGWISIIINKHVSSNRRATSLSVVSTLLKIPYVLTAYLSGRIIEEGYMTQFLYAIALLLGLISLMNLLKNLRLLNKKVTLN